MEKITRKEEEIMNVFWEKGQMFVRELVASYPDPKPHFNTLSTMVRSLEGKGYLSHTPLYSPEVTRERCEREQFKKVGHCCTKKNPSQTQC